MRHACDARKSAWYASLRKLGLSALVLHDCMPDADVVALQTQQIRFFRVDPPALFSTNDYRFMLFYGVLSGQALSASMFQALRIDLKWAPPVARVFLTDMFDVTFAGNPFNLIFGDRYHLYVGSERSRATRAAGHEEAQTSKGSRPSQTATPPGEWNPWMRDKAVACGLARNITEARGLFASSATFNAGIVGGPVLSVLALLRTMSSHMLSTPRRWQGANCNMPVLNKAVHDLFSVGSVFTGFPLHSDFKKFENGSAGAFIILK